jgi:hypothetical protein
MNAPLCRGARTPVYTSKQSRFQSRFGSVVLDERRMMAAARTVALNPASAWLAARAGDRRWSSARAHLAARDDALAFGRAALGAAQPET